MARKMFRFGIFEDWIWGSACMHAPLTRTVSSEEKTVMSYPDDTLQGMTRCLHAGPGGALYLERFSAD